jgi:hypothetical protein
MLLFRSIPVGSMLLLCAALSAQAQEPPRTSPKATSTAKVTRQVYALRGGSAKELAVALSAAFQTEGAFQVWPDAGSNSLLLSGPEAVLEEAVRVLREIDRPARMVHVTVFLLQAGATADPGAEKGLEARELSGPLADVTAKVRDLQRRGVLTGVKRVELSALTGHLTHVKLMESRPFVAGVSGGGRGGFGGQVTSQSITYREVGTLVEVKPEIGSDGVATLEVRVEDSRMQTPEGNPTLGADEKGEAVKASSFLNASLEGRVRVPLGEAVFAQGTRSSSKTGEGQVLILVAVTSEGSPRGDR